MAHPKTANEIKLLKAVQKENVKFEEIEKLLKSHVMWMNPIKLDDDTYFDYYLIIEALKRYEIRIAKLLMAQGFRVYKKTKSAQEKTVLHVAVGISHVIKEETQKIDFISILMAKGASLDIFTPDEQNKTPFHLAVDQYQIPIVELFLSEISPMDVKNLDEKYLLHYAIEKENIKVVSKLISKGLSLRKKNQNNLTPFCIALQDKKFKILNILLSHCSCKNIDIDKHDDLAPVFIASKLGNLKIIEEYVNSGSTINISLKLNTDTWSCLRNYPGFTLLHFAVQHLKIKVVEFLLGIGADIFVQNKKRLSPLHVAFKAKEKGFWKTWKNFEKNNAIIDLILMANMNFNSNPINKNGLSHFHIACSRDESTVVEHFLEHGAPINQAVKSNCQLYKGFSPLHFAAKFRCKKTMEVLLKNGADVMLTDFSKMTALHVAAKESCSETVSFLLQYGADVTSIDSHGKTPIHWAFENKSYEILDLLLSVSNVSDSNPINKEGVSHFHIACTRSNVDIVKGFIENGVAIDICVPTKPDADKNDVDWSGYSPLHFAVSHNRSKIVQLLLRSGANVGIKDNRGFTPLHMAYNYSYDMFGEYIKIALCESRKKQAGIAFESRPLTDVVKVNKAYSYGFSGSIENVNWSSNRREHMKVIDSLLNNGSDVNCTDNKGNTPVFYAYDAVTKVGSILENNPECSEFLWNQIVEDLSLELYERRKLILNNLMKLDVNANMCCKDGHILHHILSNENGDTEEIIELFLKKDVNVDVTNEEMKTPLHRAILDGNAKLVNTLLDYGANVNCIDPKDNSSPLLIASKMNASWSNNTSIIKRLLDGGANVNARHPDGRTALHNLTNLTWMTSYHVAPIVSALIKAGADINSRDSKGSTALYLACQRKNSDIVSVLLENGADVSLQNNSGSDVCSYLYQTHMKNSSAEELNHLSDSFLRTICVLEVHIIKMKVIGLSISQKASSYFSKFPAVLLKAEDKKQELNDILQKEVQKLQDTKIYHNCTLRDVMFKNENSMSHLVGNPTFKAIMKFKSFETKFPHYGYLLQLKFQAGLNRGNLLPEAKCAINNLAGFPLPDSCTENICKYFTNAELRESVEVLRGMMDLKVADYSDEMQLRSRTARKRQKVN